MTKHTPTPWEVFTDNETGLFSIGRKTSDYSGTEYGIVAESIDLKANAEFIVRAVNNHQALVEALNELVNAVSHIQQVPMYKIQKALEALSKAKGE